MSFGSYAAWGQSGSLVLRDTGSDGKPLPRTSAIYICDLNYVPVARPGAIRGTKVVVGLPPRPLLFSAYLDVPGLGGLDFTVANGGKGYLPEGQTLDVAFEAAKHRFLAAKAFIAHALGQGYSPMADIHEQLRQAELLLKRAEAAVPGSGEQAKLALESLAKSAPASERLVVEWGRRKLDRQGRLRRDQWISTFAYYEWREGDRWRKAMDRVFNAAVQNWHWQEVMRPDGTCVWDENQDNTVRRLKAMGKQIRGVTGLWLNRLPDWHPAPTLNNLETVQRGFAHQVARHAPEIQNWQIVSEPNGSWDNLGFLEPGQILQLSRAVSQETAFVRPDAQRAINTNLIWSEDAAQHLGQTPRVVCSWEFYQMLAAAAVPYERMVLQIYHEGRDLFEVDQRLEQFKAFGRPIQIELSAPSNNEPKAPGCHHFPEGHPRQTLYRWHRPWDEALQADWLEAMFVVCMSKDYVSEFCWWDLADYEDCYIPWGGLLDRDYRPKLSYDRILKLVKRWGSQPKEPTSNVQEEVSPNAERPSLWHPM
jgi:hypothetical protein